MSINNGIYVLETRDQYRVAHLKNIDYIYRSAIDENWLINKETKNKFVPSRVVELFGDSKFIRDKGKALILAHNWASKLPVCEYGVNILTYNKDWKHILIEAYKYAQKEIEFIKSNNKEELWDMELLKKIAKRYYIDEWINRERYNKDLLEHDCG